MLGTTDWIGSYSALLNDAAQKFGAQDGSKSPARGTQLPFTPIKFAVLVLQFFEDNAPEIFAGIANAYESVGADSNAKRATDLSGIHSGDNGFQIVSAEWNAIAERGNGRAVDGGGFLSSLGGVTLDLLHGTDNLIGGASRDFLGEIDEGVRRMIIAIHIGSRTSVPNDDGDGEHLPANLNSDFWLGANMVAIAAQGAQVKIAKPSLASELIDATGELPTTIGDAGEVAADAASRAAAKVSTRLAEIAGSSLGEFFGELGIIPIALGAAAVYVGVRFI